jgi:hypothetical protein
MTSTVTGIFYNEAIARQAIAQMESVGIASNQISFVMSDRARGSHLRFIESSKVDEGTAAGAGIGGLAGALAGSLMAASVVTIPGLNIVVTGALVSALAGLGTGALAGGLLGGLIGAGIPEHEAKVYEKEITRGNVLVVVQPKDSEQKKTVENIFNSFEKSAAA